MPKPPPLDLSWARTGNLGASRRKFTYVQCYSDHTQLHPSNLELVLSSMWSHDGLAAFVLGVSQSILPFLFLSIGPPRSSVIVSFAYMITKKGIS